MADDKDLCVRVTFSTPAINQSPVKTLGAAAQSHSTTLISPYHMGPQYSWEGRRWILENAGKESTAHIIGDTASSHVLTETVTAASLHLFLDALLSASLNARALPIEAGDKLHTFYYYAKHSNNI